MPPEAYFDEFQHSSELGRRALRGGAASLAGTYGSAVLQLVAAVVLARLLTPDDFGLVAIVIVLTSFAPLLIDFGLGDATTQQKTITESQVSSLFWLNTAIGSGVALIVALSAPLVAWIFKDPRLELATIYSAISFVLVEVATQHLALLRRTMQFSRIAQVQVLGTLIGVIVALALAFVGAGYWALVARPIANSLVVALCTWMACSWRPRAPSFSREIMPSVRFGLHVVGSAMAITMAKSLDRIVLGLFYRPYEIGLYQNAVVLYTYSIDNTLGQIHNIGSSALAKLQSNHEELRQKYYSALSMLSFFIMPAAAIIAVTSTDLIVTLLGEKWRGSAIFLTVMSLYGILHVVHTSQGWLHLAIGRPDRWRNWTVFAACVQAVAVFAGLPFGPIGVASAISIAGALIAFPSVSYAGKLVGIDATSAFRAVKPQLIGSVLTVALGWYFQSTILAGFSSLVRLILSGMFCASVFLFIVVVLFRCTEPIKILFRFAEDNGIINQSMWRRSR